MTRVPSLYCVPHVRPQLIPLRSESTEPVPCPDLLTLSGKRATIVVGSLVESLLVTTSPPPDTVAEFVTELEAFPATSTVTVIAG